MIACFASMLGALLVSDSKEGLAVGDAASLRSNGRSLI
jgi:hypothetical protein